MVHTRLHVIISDIYAYDPLRHEGLFSDLYEVGAKSVSSQEVTACIPSASAANRLTTRSLFGALKETEVTGREIGAVGTLVHKLMAAAS
jgi:hypothetical protein